jgi:hypothetical protein
MQDRPNKYLFSNTGEVQNYQEQDDALIVTALLCKVGAFTDSSGTEVNLTKEQLQGLVNTMARSTVRKLLKCLKMVLSQIKRCLPKL